MKKTKKIAALLLAAVLLVSATVAVTVAYLTAETGVVTNTFEVGNVQIDLDEVKVDEYGAIDETVSGRVKENDYTLIPGHEYVKDPTVYVEFGSQPCWLFVKVVNGLERIEAEDGTLMSDGTTKYVSIEKQMEANGWRSLDGVNNVYYYKTIIDARKAKVEKLVFANFMLDGEAVFEDDSHNETYDDVTIDAYAIQADGFDTALKAWTTAATTYEWGV